MRFVCDSCRAQYMISDDKVGANGVKVRCKKCSHLIVVRRQVDEAEVALRGLEDSPAPTPPPEAPTGENSIFSDVDDEEIGAAFESALGERTETPPEQPVDDTRVMDTDTVARLTALAEGNVPPATDAAPLSHEWYVAIDEKQTGPLTPQAIKQHWDQGEIGPDSLTWRQGFEDWMPLSDVAELAAWLAPHPARPVYSPASGTPAVGGGMVPMAVESAFSAGGMMRTVRSEVPTPVPDAGGWKPSASAALASLVKEEIDALSKPDAPPPAPEPAPVSRSLLEVPPVTQEVPAAQVNGRTARSEARTPVTQMERSTFAPTYGYATRPQKPTSRKGLFIGIGAAAVVVAGLVGGMLYLFQKTEKVAEVAARPPSPPPETAKPPPAPTPPVAQVTPVPTAPSTVTPPVAPPVARVTPAVPPGEAPSRRTGKGSRGTKGTASHSGGDDATASAEPAPRSGGGSKSKADDLFDEVFGTNGEKKSSSDDGSKGKRSAYVPPAPGSSSTEVPDRLPKGDIMSVVLANKPSIVRCVNEQKARDGNLHGTLVMHWTIQTSGKTTGVNAVTDQFKSSYMATCLTGLVKSWSFPKHKYQPGEPVDFPFTF
jgi:predicted Zn finger-like uncharacterized protein